MRSTEIHRREVFGFCVVLNGFRDWRSTRKGSLWIHSDIPMDGIKACHETLATWKSPPTGPGSKNGYPTMPYVSMVGMITCSESHVEANDNNDTKIGAGGRLMADETPNTFTLSETVWVKRDL